MGQATSFLSSSTVTLLGIEGLRVLWVWEFAAERQVFVETERRPQHCRGCGQRAESGQSEPATPAFIAQARPSTPHALQWHGSPWD